MLRGWFNAKWNSYDKCLVFSDEKTKLLFFGGGGGGGGDSSSSSSSGSGSSPLT